MEKALGQEIIGEAESPQGQDQLFWHNKLVSRTKGSEVRTYLYGQDTQVLEETLNGKRYALYGWGPKGLVSRTDANGQSMFYLEDAQGRVMGMVDDQGNMVEENQYSAYGEDLTGKDAVNPFRFVGGEGGRKDDDTGLVYFWNRWYDPGVGRWISEDPIRQAGGLNVYGYVGNNSMEFTDSEGKEFGVDDIIIAATVDGAVVGAANAYVTYDNTNGDYTATAEAFGSGFAAGAAAGSLAVVTTATTFATAAVATVVDLGWGILSSVTSAPSGSAPDLANGATTISANFQTNAYSSGQAATCPLSSTTTAQ